MSKEVIIVSFSGGRTSAYMSWWLINNMSWLYEFKFVYANTGQEHPKTLEFIDKVDKFLGLKLTWLEAVVHHNKRKASTHKVVSYATASRTGDVFEEVIKKYGLPKMGWMHCTRELKINPIQSWMKAEGYKDARRALGIRFDEFRRVKNDKDYIYPLATILKTTKEDVLNFWKNQSFDLEITEEQGNCWFCYKKSDKKLHKIATETPEAFTWIHEMESKYKENLSIFRHHRTVDNILNNTGLPSCISEVDECAEECGTIIVENL